VTASPLVIVSRHALERARDRYRDAALTKQSIAHDVREAIAQGRYSKHHPGNRSDHLLNGATFAWTAAGHRVYIVARRRHRETEKPCVVVRTAVLPGPRQVAA
jgi:hypothetical protein